MEKSQTTKKKVQTMGTEVDLGVWGEGTGVGLRYVVCPPVEVGETKVAVGLASRRWDRWRRGKGV